MIDAKGTRAAFRGEPSRLRTLEPRENNTNRRRVRKHEIGRGGDVVDRRMRQVAGRIEAIADQRNDAIVLLVDRRLAVGGPIDLDLGQGVAPEAFDKDEVDRSE